MRRLTIAIIGMALFTTACSLGPDQKPPRILTDAELSQLRADVQAIGDRCRVLRQSGRLRGFTASVNCSNPGILVAYEKANYPYPSVLNFALARRLQLAERVDAKSITEGDMLVDFYSDAQTLPAMCSP